MHELHNIGKHIAYRLDSFSSRSAYRQIKLSHRTAVAVDIPDCRHGIRHRRAGHTVQRHAHRTVHRHDSFVYNPFLGRNGHKTIVDTPCHSTGIDTFDCRRTAHSFAHRSFRVVAVGDVLDQHPLRFSAVAVACCNYVINRFGLGFRNSRQPESPSSRESAPHA